MAVYRRYKTGLIVDALLGSDDEAIQPTGSSSSDRPQPVVRPSASDGPQNPVSTCAARPQPIVRSPALAAQTPVSACVARPRQAARPPTPVAQTRGLPASPPARADRQRHHRHRKPRLRVVCQMIVKRCRCRLKCRSKHPCHQLKFARLSLRGRGLILWKLVGQAHDNDRSTTIGGQSKP